MTATATKPRALIWVSYDRDERVWTVKVDSVERFREKNKKDAITVAVAEANRMWLADGAWSEMKILRKKGNEITDSRTYPPSSDPRKTKG